MLSLQLENISTTQNSRKLSGGKIRELISFLAPTALRPYSLKAFTAAVAAFR